MKRTELKKKLLKKYGTLRAASRDLEINYYRLSMIVNGWVSPRPDEFTKMEKEKKENE